MSSASVERIRGDQWAEKLRRAGAWVQKLPSSSLSGLPDWLVVDADSGAFKDACRFVEAKRLEVTLGHEPIHRCTTSQRFFLGAVARHGGTAGVLIVGQENYAEFTLETAGSLVLTRELWDTVRQPYE